MWWLCTQTCISVYRFRNLKLLKPSFGFLINIIEDGCPILHLIVLSNTDLEIELFELLEDEGFNQFKNNCHSILKFWKHGLILKYPNIKSCEVKLILVFGTLYACESYYLTMKIIRSKYHLNLTDDQLTELLRTAITSMPQILKITRKKYLNIKIFNLTFLYLETFTYTIYLFIIYLLLIICL